MYQFEISFPEVALLQFVVYDEDMFGDPNPIAVAVLPFGIAANPGIRNGSWAESIAYWSADVCLVVSSGFRSVALQNIYGADLELSTLLVHMTTTYTHDNKTAELQNVRQQIMQKTNERAELLSLLFRATTKELPVA